MILTFYSVFFLAVQCERKPISTPAGNVTNENQLKSINLSLERHPAYPVYQENPDFQPLTPSSGTCTSLKSPTASSPRSPSLNHTTEKYESIISSENLQFNLKTPTLGVSSLSMEYVYEIATRLLFLTVHWTRNIQAFRSLESTDQLVLLQSSWADLFMLGVAQCSSSFPMSPLLTLAAVHMERSDGSRDHRPAVSTRDPTILYKIMSVEELLISFEKLEMDLTEYAFFKIIVLFNPGNSLHI